MNATFAQRKYPTAEIEPYYDLRFTQAKRDSLFRGREDYQKSFQAIHQDKLSNSTPMQLVFDPVPVGMQPDVTQKPIDWGLPENVVVPNGFNAQRSPTNISFLGKLFGEAAVVSLAHAYQQASKWEDMVPPLFKD